MSNVENVSKKSLVINIKKVESSLIDYIYIGRPSPYGNPFTLMGENDRENCVKKYREWIHKPEQKSLRNLMREKLRGRKLGCFCAPKLCHGDVIIEICNTPVEN